MWNTIKQGWSLAYRQPFAVCALFVYNLAWGMVIYKLLQSVILPLLHRYPVQELGKETAQLFWVEGQFQLLKTDLIVPYLWWAACLLGLRMLLHPMLNAGVFYSLHHTELNAGYRFVEGIRKLSLPYFGIYGAQTLLSFAPLYWLLPFAVEQYGKQASYPGLAKALLPALGAYAAFLFLLQLGFLILQIGKLDGRSFLYSLLFFLRHLIPIGLTALAVLAIGLTLTAAVLASAYVWAGFAALAGIQAYRLVQMFCKVWAIGTQYAYWTEKA
ncbi:hypothetical protein O9H85_19545 [Paenibacillus filicis]|uniref:DUF4013 domain-containing protein n=1 Tax=Paenibacillus gyeongsangnamensis TaxID=3388067 RepID=A0ABT4QCH5_9BACL|nr:hypothetical protein [Paenibacillus filicis]MCZ8514577.1 hypothetical protein [Paenibacillus filicis]